MKTSLVSLAIAGTFLTSQFCQAEIKNLTLDSSQTRINYQSDYTLLSIESKTKIEQSGIADVNGKGSREIYYSSGNNLTIFDVDTNQKITFKAKGKIKKIKVMNLEKNVQGLICEIGNNELVAVYLLGQNNLSYNPVFFGAGIGKIIDFEINNDSQRVIIYTASEYSKKRKEHFSEFKSLEEGFKDQVSKDDF